MQRMSLPSFLCQNKKKRIVGVKNAVPLHGVYVEINIQIGHVIYVLCQIVAWKTPY